MGKFKENVGDLFRAAYDEESAPPPRNPEKAAAANKSKVGRELDAEMRKEQARLKKVGLMVSGGLKTFQRQVTSYQKLFDDLARAQKKRADKKAAQIEWMATGGKAMYEIDEMLGTPKGGKGKGGKGMGTAGTLILYDILKKMLKQSKIISTVLDTLNKLLGLLVDVILLPFMPIIAFGLMALADGIMGLMDSPLFKLTLGGTDADYGAVGKKIAEGLLGWFTPENVAFLAAALLTAIAGALVGLPALAVIGAAILTGIAAWFLANMAYIWGDKAAEILRNLGTWFSASVAWWKIEFQNWWTGAQELFGKIGTKLSSVWDSIYSGVVGFFDRIANLPIIKQALEIAGVSTTPTITPTGTSSAGGKYPGWEKTSTTNTSYTNNSTINNVGGGDWTNILKLPTEQWGGGGGQMA